MQILLIGEIGGLKRKIVFHVLLVNANDDDINVVQLWSTFHKNGTSQKKKKFVDNVRITGY